MTRLRTWWQGQPPWRQRGYLVAAWLVSGLYVVGPDQVAVVRLCGRAGAPVPAGVWWRPPWPVGRVSRVRLAQPRRIDVAGVAALGGLGQDAGEAEALTGDQNLVRLRATVQYTVAEPRDFLFASNDTDQLVAAVVQAHLSQVVAQTAVDALMTTGQAEVTRETLAGAQQTLARYGLGLTIVSASGALNLLQEVRPPAEVKQAFDDVASARQDHERKVNEARGYANEVIPRAKGEAAELRSQAAGYQARQINEATGRAAWFAKLATEYHQAPEVTRTRLYLEAVEKIAPRLTTTVVDSNHGQRPIDLGALNAPTAEAADSGARP